MADLLSPYSPYSVGDTFAPGDSVEGESVYVGLACPNGPPGPAANVTDQQIAVVERGGCLLQEKLDTGQEYVLASDRDYGVYIFRYTGR